MPRARPNDGRIGTHAVRTTSGFTDPQEQFRAQQIGYWPGIGAPTAREPWIRCADWLALPVISDADQKFVGLKAITNDGSNYLALTAAGNYHVDWGDGTSADFASGVQAEHWYDYSAIDPGTLSVRGYKQVIVTITMQAGQTFTSLNLNVKYNRPSLPPYDSGWLDIAVAGASLSTLTIGSITANVRFRILEQFKLYANSVTSCSYMFNGCRRLSSLALNTAAVTSMSYMFDGCSSLASVPLLNTAAVTNMSYMFYNCSSLASVPLLNTAAVTSMSYMFYNCSSLASVPLLNTAAVTDMSYMFDGCSSLSSVAALNVAAVSTASRFTYIFDYCYSLASAPIVGARFALTVPSKLDRTAIVSLFNALGTASGAQTITVSANHGYVDLTVDDRAIATVKGWTIA